MNLISPSQFVKICSIGFLLGSGIATYAQVLQSKELKAASELLTKKAKGEIPASKETRRAFVTYFLAQLSETQAKFIKIELLGNDLSEIFVTDTNPGMSKEYSEDRKQQMLADKRSGNMFYDEGFKIYTTIQGGVKYRFQVTDHGMIELPQ